MNTTASNPGSLSQMRIKNGKEILSSFYNKFKNKEFLDAYRGLVTNTINLVTRKKITSKSGSYFCPICNNHSQSFYHLSNAIRFSWNSACFHCSSRGRHRGLHFLYKDFVRKLDSTKKVLHFAPEPAFYPIFKDKSFVYHTTDYILTDVDFPAIDIQKIAMPDMEYDLVLSNHVLEHVPDDMAGLTEIYRILKPNGEFILTVPGNYSKMETVYFKDLKNNGHYRDYGKDFFDKFTSVFPNARSLDLSDYNEKYNLGIQKNELVFIGKK